MTMTKQEILKLKKRSDIIKALSENKDICWDNEVLGHLTKVSKQEIKEHLGDEVHKLYEEEKQQLFEEWKKRNEQYYEEHEQEDKERGLGRDSMANYRYKQDHHKINKKFLELKIKYNLPLLESEQDYYQRLNKLFKD